MNKNIDNSKVPVSKLCTLNVERTLVLLLEWCDRTPQFSGLSLVRRVISLTYITASELDSICSKLSCLLQYWDIN